MVIHSQDMRALAQAFETQKAITDAVRLGVDPETFSTQSHVIFIISLFLLLPSGVFRLTIIPNHRDLHGFDRSIAFL